jgi:uncharacterized protein
MKQWITRSIHVALVAGLMIMVASDAWAQYPKRDEKQLMDAAAPKKARVTPSKKHRLLAFTHAVGFRHDSIPYAAHMVQLMGDKTGAWETVISDDPGMLAPEVLKSFDGIVMCSTTGELCMPNKHNDIDPAIVAALKERDSMLKKSFQEFVKNGGALIGIHAATDAWYEWEEYGNIIGGLFISHPWTKDFTVGIKNDEPNHPLNKVFNGKGFSITDEIYTFRDEPYSRDKLRILLSIDTERTDMVSDRVQRAMKTKHKDFGVAWVKTYGKGRVFYCSLGHNEHIFWDKRIMQYYQDGIQFALGDLDADTTPTGKLKK